MELKSSSKFTLSFLIIAALCLEVLLINYTIYYPQNKSWTEARLHCQKKHIDLVTWNKVNSSLLIEWLSERRLYQVWIGLHRDPEEDSVWKWINVQTGVGLSGDDLSQSNYWDKRQHGHCAVIGDDQMWHSVQCSEEYNVYCSVNDTIHHHQVTLNWYNASKYCRKIKGNLSIITRTNKHDLQSSGWIGLYRQTENNWTWIGNMSSMYRNWAPGEPLTKDCGSVDSVSKKWHSNVCSKKKSFVCYDDDLLVVNKNKTWEEAQRHCWAMKTKCESPHCKQGNGLLTVQHVGDDSNLKNRIYKATTDEVWIGLRFLGGQWWWMNGNKLEDHGNLPKCPSHMAHCGTLSKNDTNHLKTRDCTERRNFVCYKHQSDDWVL